MTGPQQLQHSALLERMGQIRVGPPVGQAPAPGEARWQRKSMEEVIQHAARRGLAAEVRGVSKESE